MNDHDHMTTAEAWCAWKKACAADLCEPDIAAMLRRFGMHRFSLYVNRYASHAGPTGKTTRSTELKDAWHLFETFAQVGKTRKGKQYKEWLFHRSDAVGETWLRAVESGATLMMRDVVREHLRREHSASFVTSLHKPIGNNAGQTFTLEDLIPDRIEIHEEMDGKEWAELARRHADTFYSMLESRDRIVLWASSQGVSFTNPRLLKWTRCSSSTLHKIYRDTIQLMCATLKKIYPGEPPSVLTHVAGLTLSELNQITLFKINSEKGAARFLKVI